MDHPLNTGRRLREWLVAGADLISFVGMSVVLSCSPFRLSMPVAEPTSEQIRSAPTAEVEKLQNVSTVRSDEARADNAACGECRPL
jgi:hypothetical protein